MTGREGVTNASAQEAASLASGTDAAMEHRDPSPIRLTGDPQDRPGSEPPGSTVSPNVEFSVDPAPHEMLIRQQPGFGKSTIDGNCWYPAPANVSAPAILRVTTGVAAAAGCARSVSCPDEIGARINHRILFVLPSGRSPLATNSVANKTPTTSGGRPTAQGTRPSPPAQDGSPGPVPTAVPPQPAPVACQPRTDAETEAECCATAGPAGAQPAPTRAATARSIGRAMPTCGAEACAIRHRFDR
jgi:hypothetical protein